MRTLPILILALIGGIIIGYTNSKHDSDDVNIWPIIIPAMIIVIIISLKRSLNKQKELLKSYKITIDNNSIWRDQMNTPSIRIYTSEVVEICKQSNGSILIKTKESENSIFIPAQIENYEDLELALKNIKPINLNQSKTLFQKYAIYLVLAMFALMVVFFITTNKVAILLTGPVLIATLVWSLVKGLKSKNIDSKTKRSSLWVIVVILSIIFKIVTTVMNV
jgi:hypothetical protein